MGDPIFPSGRRAMAGSLTGDVIRLRLPVRPEHLAVLRAVVGVVAGTMDFTYDVIMELRVAVSELFDRVGDRLGDSVGPDAPDLTVELVIGEGRLEILVVPPPGGGDLLDGESGEESRVLLESLMDKVDRVEGNAVRMVKYRRSLS